MTELSEEYRTVAEFGGWRVDRRRGRIRVAGRDATSFLHALVTADVAAVPAGGGAYAAYLTPQGRMITDLALYRLEDGWLVDLPPGMAPVLLAKLDGLIFAEDVSLADASGAIGLVSVLGGPAAAIAAAAVGLDAGRIAALPMRGTVSADGIIVAKTDAAVGATFDVFCPAADVEAVTARLNGAGAPVVSDAVAEVCRVEAGRPAFGVDMTSETIPLEAGLLDRAISLTKGCYVGQEVIVRVLHRGGGRVAKRLMRLEGAGASVPAVGSALRVGEREVGAITSAVFSPSRGRWIALGYVHREFALDRQAVHLHSGAGEVEATVAGEAG